MKFYFADWQSFIAMGTHGFYVWTCYGIVFAVILMLIVQPHWQLKQLKKQRKTLAQRKQQQTADITGNIS